MKTHTDKEVVELFNEFYNTKAITYFEHNRLMDFLKEKGLTEEFGAGKWYKDEENSFVYYKDLVYGYGFDIDGKWIDVGYPHGSIDSSEWTPATPQEVGQALIKEAKKKGFKEGVSCYWDDVNTTHYDMSGVIIYSHEGNYLTMNGDIFYQDGKWADLVEEKEKCNCKRFKLVGNLQDTFCGYCIKDSQYEEKEEKKEEITLDKYNDAWDNFLNSLGMTREEFDMLQEKADELNIEVSTIMDILNNFEVNGETYIKK
jgi:hypothetical protein